MYRRKRVLVSTLMQADQHSYSYHGHPIYQKS
uniref:Uncharacterized protein n=1 Tax=Anguilla anguilla TaxID=7936 RepID=A0A0E9TLG1_ANGAN